MTGRNTTSIVEGQKIAKWTVLKRIKKENDTRVYWLCQCECGNTNIVASSNLMYGKSRNCVKCKGKKGKENSFYKHGQSNNPLFFVWNNMKERCFNIHDKNYKWYGKRGIKVCSEWMDFNSFYIWAIDNGYKKGLTIDRIDVNGNYEPSNCKWATRKEQGRNKRNNHFVEYDEYIFCIAEWSEILKVSRSSLNIWINEGRSIQDFCMRRNIDLDDVLKDIEKNEKK